MKTKEKKLEELGMFLNAQMEKLNSPVGMNRDELNELLDKWIDVIKSKSIDKDFAASFALGFMKVTITDLLLKELTGLEVVNEIKRMI